VARRALNPGLRRLWRGDGALQLGVDPARAVVVDGLEGTDEPFLALLDGSRTTAQAAAAAGLSVERAEGIVRLLERAGALCDGTPLATVGDRLLPDALSLSLQHPGGSGAALLLRRSMRRVAVHGAGRVGATLAGLLAAAGVGSIDCVDDAAVRAADLSPGGLRPGTARTRGGAARQLVAHTGRAAYAGRVPSQAAQGRPQAAGGHPVPRRPDLVVLAPAGPATSAPDAAAAAGAVHAEVVVRETSLAVGPLVVPGISACRLCADLWRADRDPQWPMLRAQLDGGERRIEACDITLAALAAALTAGHVLRWLDDPALAGDPEPGRRHPLVGAVVELSLETLRTRRRTVTPHPDCGCGAAG
jgi:bacteriocin biosynthesis cyclodehydratase domain-containing protein